MKKTILQPDAGEAIGDVSNDKKESVDGRKSMKKQSKKCLMCFKNTSPGAKKCEHCGLRFKSSTRKTLLDRLKDAFSHLSGIGA